ncbi:TIGR02099 family protein [Microbulbifer flavimaris]|uniref:TIGR02099 family protein n=1 Tax=Microbulbifer flavimaris TaxID=1781068 RepID=A0ABX4I227_9GAMM|nr:TIGR02099 family protein [Microbulbifer flavimaris]
MLAVRWLARKFWLLVITVVICLAILVQTGRMLSPHVQEFRPQISAWFSARLGVPVQVERLSLRWQALEVALQLEGLRLGQDGEMQMGYGLFHLDLLASLWNRDLVWKNLQVHDFKAGAHRDARGRWQLDGFPDSAMPAGDSAMPQQMGDPARLFRLGPKIHIRDASFSIRLDDGQLAQLQLPQVLLENSGDFHRLIGKAFISRSGASADTDNNLEGSGERETLRLILEGRGDARDSENFHLRGYLQLNELLVDADVVDLLQQLTPLPDHYHWRGPKLARGSLWLDGSSSAYQLRGHLDLAQSDQGQAVAESADPSTADAPGAALAPLSSVSGDLSGEWLPGDSWRLALQEVQIGWRDLAVPTFNLQARGSASEGFRLAVDTIDLATWSGILSRMELLRGPADEWLQALSPSGRLQGLQFSRGGDGQVALAAELHDISAAAHKGAPAVQQLDGYLQLRGGRGIVELDVSEGFTLHFPKLYEQPFTLDGARGTLAWAVDRDNNSVQVYSGPLALRGSLGKIDGQFLLELPFKPHSRAAALTLALGLQDAPVTAQRLLVPFTASDELRDWLRRAVGKENPGRVTRAGFIYRGYAYKEGENRALLALGEHPERQTLQLAADIREADLLFASDWPRARQIDAHLKIDDRHTLVTAPSARLWDLAARDIEVGISPDPSGEGAMLGVRALASGSAADGLRLLRETPLRDRVGTAFDHWRLDGSIAGSITLQQPLGGAALTPRQTVQVELQQADLLMEHLDLQVRRLDGEVRYDSDTGLAGSAFQGQLWGRDLRAEITHPEEGGLQDTQVVIRGDAATDSVRQWSGRPELGWMNGDFEYRALVTIPAAARELPYSAVVQLTSDLAGVAVNLPSPLGKPAQQRSEFVLRIPIGADGNLYHLNYGEHLKGQFWQVGGALDRGAIALNAEAALPSERGLNVTGHLSSIDFPRWRELLEVYSADSETGHEGAAASADQNPLPVRLDLSTDRLMLGAATVEHIHVRGRGLGADWQLSFDSEMATGQLSGVLGAETPMEVELEHLRLPGSDEGEQGQPDEQQVVSGSETDNNGEDSKQSMAAGGKRDPLAGFDFSQLPHMDFSTDSLWFGDEDYGRWSFRVRPSAERLVVSDIIGAARGVRVEGRGEGPNRLGAQLMWMRDADGRESSQFIGRLSADNLADVQRASGQEPLIESQSATFDTALRWDGSPLQLTPRQLTGDLKIDIRDGRFLRATDSAGSALLRLLSLFNFDTWARRLRLDFSDLYQSGMAFDQVRGEVFFEGDGELLIAVPIQVEGPTSELQMAGRVNLERENLDLTLVATLPVGNNLALIAALAGGLPAAAGVYLISKAFKKQVNSVASVSYRISGDWTEPEVRFDKLFDGDGATRQGSEAEQQGRLQRERGPTEAVNVNARRASGASEEVGEKRSAVM